MSGTPEHRFLLPRAARFVTDSVGRPFPFRMRARCTLRRDRSVPPAPGGSVATLLPDYPFQRGTGRRVEPFRHATGKKGLTACQGGVLHGFAPHGGGLGR